MRNELLKSVLIVFAFWFTVLTVFALPDLATLKASFISLGLIWSGGVLLGFGIWFLRRGFKSAPAQPKASHKGPAPVATATIMSDPQAKEFLAVPLPSALMPEMARRIKAASSNHGLDSAAQAMMQRYPWWGSFVAKNPLYAAALMDVWRVLLSKKGLPAAPVPQDHGGATLAQHSLNVLDAMLELAPAWRYEGVRDTKGKVVVPVADVNRGFHVFERGDPVLNPMLVLAAIAHDIGKVECYRQIDAARPERVEEVAPNHGEMGAKLLRGVPSLMALGMSERQTLLLVVRYYHQLSNMPIAGWIGDMPRSLTMLLYEADCLAAWREGGRDEAKMQSAAVQRAVHGQVPFGGDMEDVPQECVSEEAVEGEVGDAAEQEAQSLIERARGSGTGQKREHKAASSPAPSGEVMRPYWTHPTGRTPLDFMIEALAGDGAINGKNTAKRIAFWSAPWLYVIDQKLRAALAEIADESTVDRGQMAPFTKELLAQLEDRGMLYKTHGGMTLSHKRALWLCTVADSNKFTMFIVSDECVAQPILANAGTIKEAPQIERPRWGTTSALNKKAAAQGNEQAEPGQAGVDDDASEASTPAEDSQEAQDAKHVQETDASQADDVLSLLLPGYGVGEDASADEAPMPAEHGQNAQDVQQTAPAPAEDVSPVLPPSLNGATVESTDPDDAELALPPKPALDLFRLKQDVRLGLYMPELRDDGTVWIDAAMVWNSYEKPDKLPDGIKQVARKGSDKMKLTFNMSPPP